VADHRTVLDEREKMLEDVQKAMVKDGAAVLI
jgi:hypothetical protein